MPRLATFETRPFKTTRRLTLVSPSFRISQGELADTPSENLSVACSRLTDLLRKASGDSALLKVPLRSLRDFILLNAHTEGESCEEVRLLFQLFDGAHDQCVRMQSPGSCGPYELVEKALRLRLFLCVSGESWKNHPYLRAMALRRLRRFAVEEVVFEKKQKEDTKKTKQSSPQSSGSGSSTSSTSSPFSPGRTTVVTSKDAASAPSRLPTGKSTAAPTGTYASSLFKRAPSAVHSAVIVSSWREVYSELTKVPTARMLPVMSALLDDLHDAEEFIPVSRRDSKPVPLERHTVTTPLETVKGTRNNSDSFSSQTSNQTTPQITTPTQNFIEGWHRFDAPTPVNGAPGVSTSVASSTHTVTPSSGTQADNASRQRTQFDAAMRSLSIDK